MWQTFYYCVSFYFISKQQLLFERLVSDMFLLLPLFFYNTYFSVAFCKISLVISFVYVDPIFRCAQIPVSCPDVPLSSHTYRYCLTSAFRLHRSFLYRLPEFVCFTSESGRPESWQLAKFVNASQFIRRKSQ